MAGEIYDKFDLHIELGNEKMNSGLDVARVLRIIADKIQFGFEARGRIYDENGNTVGSYGPS
jgi:hypothetical protein